MILDEKVYQNSHIFFPEWYLPRPVGFGEPHPQCIFGFGRRWTPYPPLSHLKGTHGTFSICPGRHLAEASVWIAIATLLAVFDICPVQDENGKDDIPTAVFQTSITRYFAQSPCFLSLCLNACTAILSPSNASSDQGQKLSKVCCLIDWNRSDILLVV